MDHYTFSFDTPLGPMVAMADDASLYRLAFSDQNNRKHSASTVGASKPIELIQQELALYFAGRLRNFTTPLQFTGTTFQIQVWSSLQRIPYGKTWSYASLAQDIKKPTACRAVAQANGANQFAIIVPCHRVINANGQIGGYNGGIARKQWLLKHEHSYA